MPSQDEGDGLPVVSPHAVIRQRRKIPSTVRIMSLPIAAMTNLTGQRGDQLPSSSR